MVKTIKKENLSLTNWRVMHPNGKFMFFADDKKKDWYLSRNLATQLNEQSIQLTFKPNGNGYHESDIFGVNPRKICCVCCGEKDAALMQKHHIVPYMYRKHMPDRYKSKNHHDVVLICYYCHESYELYATVLKKELMSKYNIIDDIGTRQKTVCVNMYGKEGDYSNIASYVAAILNTHKKLPVDVLAWMLPVVEDFMNKKNLSVAELEAAQVFIRENKPHITQNVVPIGEQVLAYTEDLDNFVYLWRQHFIDTMQPKYMPVGWSLMRQPVSRLN